MGSGYRFAALRAARQARGVSVVHMAYALGVSRQAIWRLEHGHAPSLSLIRKAADYFGLDWRAVVTPTTLNNTGEWLAARAR